MKQIQLFLLAAIVVLASAPAGAQTTLEAWKRGETPPTDNDGIVMIAEDSTANAPDHRAMPTHEYFHRRLVTAVDEDAGAGRQQELPDCQAAKGSPLSTH